MQYSFINKSNLVSDFRLDAECYKKEYLDIDNILSNLPHSTIEEEVSVFAKGIFDIKAECYTNAGVPFVRIADLKNMVIDDLSLIHIPKEENRKYKKTSLCYGDLILSKTAYPAASLVTLSKCNTSQDTIAVKLKKDSSFKSHFLVLFLNCKHGYLQMQRWFTGNVQMHLNLSDSKSILIPSFSNNFQKTIKDFFEKSISTIESSKSIYKKAHTLLLSELGLSDWQPKHQLSFVKNFSDTQEAERIDAEYFQPKYEEIEEAIKSYSGGYSIIKNEFKQNKSTFIIDDEKKYQYVEIGSVNVSNGEIVPNEVLGSELPANAKRKLKKSDVIISKVRTY